MEKNLQGYKDINRQGRQERQGKKIRAITFLPFFECFLAFLAALAVQLHFLLRRMSKPALAASSAADAGSGTA
ncbi:MAG: hypothetical protein ABSH22_12770 [Tepidisphaeraceae bacterium]